jgi:hypothetical protein
VTDVDEAWAARPVDLRSVDAYFWGPATWVEDIGYASAHEVSDAVRAAPEGIVFLRIERWLAVLGSLASLSRERTVVPVLVFDQRIILGPALTSSTESDVYVRRVLRDLPAVPAVVDASAELIGQPTSSFSSPMLEALWRAPRRPAPRASYLVIDLLDGSTHWAQTAFAPVGSGNELTLTGPVSPVSAIAEVPKGLKPIHVVTAVIRGDRFGRGGAAALTEQSAKTRAAAEAIERSALRRLYVALRAGDQRGLVPMNVAAVGAEAADRLRDALGNSTWDSTSIVCGTAVERTNDAAATAAQLEVIERRAVSTARWYDEIPDEALPKDLTAALARQNLSLRCWRLQSPYAGNAVLAELRGHDGFAYGVAAGIDDARTLEHAIEEASLMFSYRCENKTLLPELQFAAHGLSPDHEFPSIGVPSPTAPATWIWSDDELCASGLVLGLAVDDVDPRAEQTLPPWIFEGTA